MGLKDIFKIQKTVETEHKIQQENIDNSITVISLESFKSKGAEDAGYCGGIPQALLPQLHAVYTQLSRYIQGKKVLQDERKNKVREEITGIEAKNTNLENQIKHEQGKLTHEESRIVKIEKDIENIKENPKLVSGDSFTKASFWIGLVIIVFLTVYLFVFYSSASFSAFFRDFTSDNTKIAQAIFHANALSDAYFGTNTTKGGPLAVLLILTIPFVFLGLGFLIHKFSEEKGIFKYLKILGLTAVTFIFDFIIAYEIVEKIYNIRREGSFEEMDKMSILGRNAGEVAAIQQVNFWLIIFAGFVVYIIWGLVFNFTMKEYERMDKVRYAIRNKEQKLAECKAECIQIKNKILNLQTEKNSNQGEINKLKIRLETYVVYFNDVSEGINNYFTGWVGYLKSIAAPQVLIDECNQIKDKFLSDLQDNEFIKE